VLATQCAWPGSRLAPSPAPSRILPVAWKRVSPFGGTTMALVPAAASRWMPPKLSSSRRVASPAYPAPAAVAGCARGGGGSRSTRAPDGPSSSAGRWNRAWTHLLRLAVCLALLCCAAAAGAGPDLSAACMPAPSERTVAFRNTVVFNLGAGAVGDVRWNTRTTVPTLSSFAPLRALAARRGWDLEAWFFDDGACTALEAAEGRWQPAIAAIAFPPGVVSSSHRAAPARRRSLMELSSGRGRAAPRSPEESRCRQLAAGPRGPLRLSSGQGHVAP
jgi:hypothetical protein